MLVYPPFTPHTASVPLQSLCSKRQVSTISVWRAWPVTRVTNPLRATPQGRRSVNRLNRPPLSATFSPITRKMSLLFRVQVEIHAKLWDKHSNARQFQFNKTPFSKIIPSEMCTWLFLLALSITAPSILTTLWATSKELKRSFLCLFLAVSVDSDCTVEWI